MAKIEVKNFMAPDEIRQFEKGKIEFLRISGVVVGRATFLPGWKWSEHVRPIAKTNSCPASHFQYQISGTLHVVMDDGTEKDLKAGDVSRIPPGHDAWVVGHEPVVFVDFQGMGIYAAEAQPADPKR